MLPKVPNARPVLTTTVGMQTQAPASSVMAPGPCQLNIGELGNHVGDWERIQVRFNYNETNGTAPVPTQVTLSQHNGVARYNWGDRNLTLLDGTHPVAYAANGSHGKLLFH